MTIVFSNSSPKVPKWGIFSPKCKEFYFCAKLCNKANLRALFLNVTLVFQNCCPKHSNRAFLVLDLRIFISASNFVFRKLGGCWFQIWQYLFQIPAQKYPNKAFFVPNLSIFILVKIFAIRQIRGRWF